MGEKEENRRIVVRYALATLLATVGIYLLESYFRNSFDSVAAVGLFSCIIAVTGEDTSLGPVIYKSACRGAGACLGGICGYALLFIPLRVMSANRKLALIIVPTVFVAMVQWLTKGGSERLTVFVKNKKLGHLIIQLQVAFGAVFVGSWSAPEDALMLSAGRTVGILYGCVTLLFAAVVAFPQTSLHASCEQLSASLRASGGLLEALCRDRIEGRSMDPYDHSKRDFVTDEHVALLGKLDTMLARVLFLQPFLYFEPNWALGYPLVLATKDTSLSTEWATFVSVTASRLNRVRATLSAMDSNARIDSDQPGKYYRAEISSALHSLSTMTKRALHTIALYTESPFEGASGWRGAVSLREDMQRDLAEVKTQIELLVAAVAQQVATHNSVRDRSRQVESAGSDSAAAVAQASGVRGPADRSRYQPQRQRPRNHLGSTLDSWHKIHPMRSFCTLSVQMAVQTSSLLSETIRFIDVVSEGDELGLPPRGAHGSFQAVAAAEVSAEELVESAIAAPSAQDGDGGPGWPSGEGGGVVNPMLPTRENLFIF